MQKALTQTNIQPANVISDLSGVTGPHTTKEETVSNKLNSSGGKPTNSGYRSSLLTIELTAKKSLESRKTGNSEY